MGNMIGKMGASSNVRDETNPRPPANVASAVAAGLARSIRSLMQRDRPSPALQALLDQANERQLADLPAVIKMKIAAAADPTSRKNLRLTGSAEWREAGTEAIQHVEAFNSEILRSALATFRPGGVTEITLGYGSFSDQNLKDLPPELKRLTLKGYDWLTDAGLAHLASLKLERLTMTECHNVTGKGLSSLATLPLQHLGLTRPHIKGKDLAHLPPQLRSLHLISNDGITDEGMVHLSRRPLQSLSLPGAKITDVGLAQLQNLQLQKVNFEECLDISNTGLAHLTGMPLQELSLENCDQIRDAGLLHLRELPLQKLNLNFCDQITDAGLAHLQGLPLQSLQLADCTLSDAGLVQLQAFPLQHLVLAGARISDASLEHLRDLPLQSLALIYCGEITDASMAHPSQIPLQHIDLTASPGITPAGRDRLVQDHPGITIVS